MGKVQDRISYLEAQITEYQEELAFLIAHTPVAIITTALSEIGRRIEEMSHKEVADEIVAKLNKQGHLQ